jgi:hypothetical protein
MCVYVVLVMCGHIVFTVAPRANEHVLVHGMGGGLCRLYYFPFLANHPPMDTIFINSYSKIGHVFQRETMVLAGSSGPESWAFDVEQN